MKKLVILIIAVVFIFLTACSANNDGDTGEAVITDYFPLQANVFMDYEGVGNEYAEEKTYVDYLHDNTIQIRSVNPGTTMVRVYKIENGELKMVFSQGETYYLADFTGKAGDNPDTLLKEPLAKGTEWQSADGHKRYISDVDIEVETPSGKYQALAVTTEGDDNSITRVYYVKDIGIVKKEFVAGDSIVTTSLKTLNTDAKGEIGVSFYYPDFNAEKLGYALKTLTYYTNDTLISGFEDNFRDPPDDSLSPVISENTRINDMYLDPDKGIAYIDFTQSLVTDMNAGSSLEGMIIQSITNTLAGYYQTEKVFILLDGKPYESGHFMLTEGTWFEPNYENSYPVS